MGTGPDHGKLLPGPCPPSQVPPFSCVLFTKILHDDSSQESGEGGGPAGAIPRERPPEGHL